MPVTEDKITLPDGAGDERVLKDTATGRLMEVVASVNSGGTLINPGTEETLQLILAAIQAGGSGVTWPMAITLLTEDPAPQAGKVLFYALTDGVASPNNVITLKYLFPDGTQVINQVMTV